MAGESSQQGHQSAVAPPTIPSQSMVGKRQRDDADPGDQDRVRDLPRQAQTRDREHDGQGDVERVHADARSTDGDGDAVMAAMSNVIAFKGWEWAHQRE